MGGMYQEKTFNDLAQLLEFIREQVSAANRMGLYLQQGVIEQSDIQEYTLEWIAYYSK